MSKKSKNFIFVLVGIFFVSIALLYSENSSKIVAISENVEKQAEESVSEEFIFGTIENESVEEIKKVLVNDEDKLTQISANSYKVVNVVDGDTVDVIINGKEERLRLIGIDTPETKDPRKGVECFGKEASEKTKEVLLGKNVVLESDESQSERDRYGRLLRYIFLEDGTNFNLFLIQEGFANEYTYDSSYNYQKEFRNAENEAKEGRKGLWGDVCDFK